MGIPIKDYRINEQIRAREILVIAENGEQLGVLPTMRALQLARERDLDLVEVSPTANPPVCRVMDYGKFRYTQTKKEREARKTQKGGLLREIRFRPGIAPHDRDAKLRRAQELLEHGNKVKLSVIFRGREMSHQDLGLNLLRGLAQTLKETARLEGPPGLEGRSLSIVMIPLPRREIKAATAATAPAEEKQRAKEAKEVKA